MLADLLALSLVTWHFLVRAAVVLKFTVLKITMLRIVLLKVALMNILLLKIVLLKIVLLKIVVLEVGMQDLVVLELLPLEQCGELSGVLGVEAEHHPGAAPRVVDRVGDVAGHGLRAVLTTPAAGGTPMCPPAFELGSGTLGAGGEFWIAHGCCSRLRS
ncbi:hypothetical protein [Sinosporangium siamense]|uniref:Uncharacterized protein n=1 Tax=Sinosporangium siamense TaxID=1367973 RepID=A0A919V8L3_9ACTN|nr:hypothetical protein [Sinosporangium siamense]GII96255.1 hypothetical protein Ssi02_64860 [Sinosporangium siamense]